MKFIKLDLLTLLISLFLFSSCEKAATIGLEIDPTIALQGDLVDTLTVSSRTVMDENGSTLGLTRHPLGYLKDPIFGTTESSLSMSVGLPEQGDAYSFGTNPVIDSAVLVLNYAGEFYGDSTANYSIDVHQLSADLTDAPTYLNTTAYPFNSSVIGNKTGKIYPTTPFKITDIVQGAADTLKNVTPQIRIKLDNSFITNNMLNLTAADLKNNVRFASVFKGLHVNINKTASSGVGGLMFFDFGSKNSNLMLYYRKQNETTTTATDTVTANFPISASFGPIAATIKHDYTGTDIATQLGNPNKQYAVTYLQPLVGLRNKISFPYLAKFAANIGKIAINKAELVIDLSAGTDAQPFAAAPRLTMYKYDIAEKRENIEIYSSDPQAIGGYFNAVKKQYVFNLTTYVQNLLDGKTKDYGTFLAPTPSKEFITSPSLSSASRAVINSFKQGAAAGDKVMKLNIYYTKIN